MQIPRSVVYVLLILVALSFVPLAIVVRARTASSPKPPVHLVPDMDSQPKATAQSASTLFADGRAMRLPVEGTVARGELTLDDALHRGRIGEAFITEYPDGVELTESLLRRGQERYNVCGAPCHGQAGYGDGPVSQRAVELAEGTWVPPTNFHDEGIRERELGHLYNTVVNGIRNMPGYGAQIPLEDRWAIVAYVKALQRSQYATIDDVPAEQRDRLR